MVRVYIAKPDKYLNTARPDKALRDLYGDYPDNELRGLVGVTIQGFNALRRLSFRERNITREEEGSHGLVDGTLSIARIGLRSLFGGYTQAICVFGKPERIERVTYPHESDIDRPINGQPFLDHDYDHVGEYLQSQRLSSGVFGFDIKGNVFGARRFVVPQGFELNGAGEEVTSVCGTGSVNPEHVQAAHASENGLSSIVLSKDGSVITFFGGYPIRNLTYKPGDKF